MQIDIDGSGPSLVLVHSLLTDARAFDPVVSKLAARRRVVRPALPGFGDTPRLEAESLGIFDLADWLAEALSAADADRDAAVLGTGLGAFVSVALAIAHGDRFGPLIVSNGGAVFPENRRGAFITMSELVTGSGMEAVVDVAVRRIFPESWLDAHPEVFEERREVLVGVDPLAFAAACRALHDMDMSSQVASITNPTLVITGGDDQTTPPELGRRLAAAIGGAELVELAGCGHCPPLQQPEPFLAAIESFLDRV
jgi:3-oxoadipate enol-lactonase